MNDLKLFREEAIEAYGSRLGNPNRQIDIGAKIVGVVILSALLLLLVFSAIGDYPRKQAVQGHVTLGSGSVRATSTRQGVVSDLHVSEGNSVRQGQAIATITLDSTLADGNQLGKMVDEAVTAQTEARISELQIQIGQVSNNEEELRTKKRAQIAQQLRLRSELSLQKERIALLEKTISDITGLVDKRYVSPLQFRQFNGELIDAKLKLSMIERESAVAEAAESEIEAQLLSQASERDKLASQILKEKASLLERTASLAAQRDIVIASPIDGTVTALSSRKGDSVLPDTVVALVTPSTGAYEVEVLIPSRAIGFITSGREVRLKFDSFPYQRFGTLGGRIKSVSSSPLTPLDLPRSVEIKEPMYKAIVAIDKPYVVAYGRKWPLTQGMGVTADIVLEHRSFLQWMLDPIRAARQ